MMKQILITLSLFLSLLTQAKTLAKTSILAEYKSEEAKFAQADDVLNKVRLATVNTQTAIEYAAEIEKTLQQFPDYPYKAEAYYFLGLNYKIAAEYDRATIACTKALELKPELKDKTPIESFITGAQFESRALWVPRYAYAAVVFVLLFGLIITIKSKPTAVIKRYAIASSALLVSWIVIFAAIASIDSVDHVTQTADYPQPVLINTTIASIGDAPLMGVLYYGLASVALVVIFVYLTSSLKSFNTRKYLNITASLTISCSAMVLCYMDFCYRNAIFIWDGQLISSRMNILIKDLVWRDEIPDEMLSLYDEGFRARILESRQQK